MILSSVIIQCSSFSEREFLELNERLGLLEQNVYNDDRLKKLENKVESLINDMGNQCKDLDEGKCLNYFFSLLQRKSTNNTFNTFK